MVLIDTDNYEVRRIELKDENGNTYLGHDRILVPKVKLYDPKDFREYKKRGKYKVKTLEDCLNAELTDEQKQRTVTLLKELIAKHNYKDSQSAHEIYWIFDFACQARLIKEVPKDLYARLSNTGIKIKLPKATFNYNIPPGKDNKEVYEKEAYEALVTEIGSRFEDILNDK